MQVRYDFHIHSGLSPCADKDMTPVNIVGYAKINGIDMIAIADHNSILNVEVARRAGENFGVTVVPAMELQTAEEVHILCLFENFKNLEKFYEKLCFLNIKNRPDLYGEQLIFDEDDSILGTVENLLLTSATISTDEVKELVEMFGGVAIPAHIDRESNGMVQILGAVTPEFDIVELSSNATNEQIEKYSQNYRVIVDSDAHTLDQICGQRLELEDNSISALFKWFRTGKSC